MMAVGNPLKGLTVVLQLYAAVVYVGVLYVTAWFAAAWAHPHYAGAIDLPPALMAAPVALALHAPLLVLSGAVRGRRSSRDIG